MKKIYCRVSTFLVTFISSIIALLTTSSCVRIAPGRVEYGTPSAEFEVKATVLSEQGTPLRNIQVDLLDENGRVLDRELTDIAGDAELEENMTFLRESVRQVRATDIDGVQNGLWEQATVTVNTKDFTVENEGKWRKKIEAHLIIRLREKK